MFQKLPATKPKTIAPLSGILLFLSDVLLSRVRVRVHDVDTDPQAPSLYITWGMKSIEIRLWDLLWAVWRFGDLEPQSKSHP